MRDTNNRNYTDPFFEFFDRERTGISQHLYGAAEEPFKEYPDLPVLDLPEVETDDPLSSALLARRSARTYKEEAIELEDISYILRTSAGLRPGTKKRRVYPSGGAKYPTEIYVLTPRVTGLDQALYHYNVREHALVRLKSIEQSEYYACFPLNESNFALFDAAAVILMTFSKNRSVKKYNTLAYKLGLIEVGHIGQNVYLASQNRQLGCRAHAGGVSSAINKLLEIDGKGEHIVYTMSLGKLK